MSEYTADAASPTDDTLAPHVLDFLLRDGDRVDPSADTSRDRVLEVAQVFGDAVVDLKHFARGRAVSLGATLRKSWRGTQRIEDFAVPVAHLPAPTYAVFEADASGWSCVAAPGWSGWVDGPAGRRSLDTLQAVAAPGPDGLYRLRLGPEDTAVIEVGTSIFVARSVHPSRRVPVQGRDNLDYPLLGIAAFMGVVAAAFGLAVSTLPAPPDVHDQGATDRLVEVLLQHPVELPKPATPKPVETGERAKRAEGARGEPDARQAKARSLEPRRQDRAIAETAGILGALDRNASLDSLLGESGLPSSLAGGIGSLIGPRGTQRGVGLGDRGGGLGGGGTAEGVGSVGPRGPGGGCADCGRIERSAPPAVRTEGEVISIGALDKSLVDQVVKRNMAQIRYCYQRELTKDPNLGGKVTVKFVIAGDGSVSSATTRSSTLGNASAESCINGRFMRMQFPAPKGGGIVIVSYPFLFSPG